MKLPRKLRAYKAENKLKFKEIAMYFGLSVQTIKDWCNEDRCPNRLQPNHAALMVKFTNNAITLRDAGY